MPEQAESILDQAFTPEVKRLLEFAGVGLLVLAILARVSEKGRYDDFFDWPGVGMFTLLTIPCVLPIWLRPLTFTEYTRRQRFAVIMCLAMGVLIWLPIFWSAWAEADGWYSEFSWLMIIVFPAAAVYLALGWREDSDGPSS